MRNLAQLLAARPELSRLADVALLGGSADLSLLVGTPEEKAFLLELLQILGDGTRPVSLSEAFRGTRFEEIARTLERNGIAAEGGELEGARQEFLDGWQKMVEAVRDAERRELEPRVSSGEASAEERERYRKLQGSSPARLNS